MQAVLRTSKHSFHLLCEDFLDIEHLRNTALVEFFQRITEMGAAPLHMRTNAELYLAHGADGLLHAQRTLPDAIAEDSFLLDAILAVAVRPSPSFHRQWASTFMPTPETKVHQTLLPLCPPPRPRYTKSQPFCADYPDQGWVRD